VALECEQALVQASGIQAVGSQLPQAVDAVGKFSQMLRCSLVAFPGGPTLQQLQPSLNGAR
jgi:hypothetical protein